MLQICNELQKRNKPSLKLQCIPTKGLSLYQPLVLVANMQRKCRWFSFFLQVMIQFKIYK